MERRTKIRGHNGNTPFTTRTVWTAVCICVCLFLHNTIFLTSSNNNVHKNTMLFAKESVALRLNVLHLCWKPCANAAAAGGVFFCLRLSLNCSVLLLHLHYITLSHFRLLIVFVTKTKNILTQFIY